MGPNRGSKTAPICIADLGGHSLFGLRCWKACQDDQLRKIPCSWGPQPDDPKGAKTTSCAKSRVQLGAILGPSEEEYREIPQPTLNAKKPRKRPTGLGGRGDNEPNYLTRQGAKARRIISSLFIKIDLLFIYYLICWLPPIIGGTLINEYIGGTCRFIIF